MRLSEKEQPFLLPLLILIVIISHCSSVFAERSLFENHHHVLDEPDTELEGMLIDDDPSSANDTTLSSTSTASSHDVNIPPINFTSALELQPPHQVSTTSGITSKYNASNPASIPVSQQPNSSNQSGTSTGSSNINPIFPAQTALPTPNSKNSSPSNFNTAPSYELLGLSILFSYLTSKIN